MDTTDPDMRNRVIQIVDDVLLGTGNAETKSHEEVKKEPLTITSRAVGLAIILDSLQMFDRKGTIGTEESNAFKWMRSLLCQRNCSTRSACISKHDLRQSAVLKVSFRQLVVK